MLKPLVSPKTLLKEIEDVFASALAKRKIKEFEGCKLKAYVDQGGILTIGYGYTGPEVTQGMTITQLAADSLLSDKLRILGVEVTKILTVPVTQNQFDALISLAYNIGIGNLRGSTLLKKLNNSDYKGAAEEFLKWHFVKAVPNEGLLKRREAEKALFLSP